MKSSEKNQGNPSVYTASRAQEPIEAGNLPDGRLLAVLTSVSLADEQPIWELSRQVSIDQGMSEKSLLREDVRVDTVVQGHTTGQRFGGSRDLGELQFRQRFHFVNETYESNVQPYVS
jgi:hypothetical protein